MATLAFFEEKTGSNENIEWMLLTIAVVTLTIWVVVTIVRIFRRKIRKPN